MTYLIGSDDGVNYTPEGIEVSRQYLTEFRANLMQDMLTDPDVPSHIVMLTHIIAQLARLKELTDEG